MTTRVDRLWAWLAPLAAPDRRIEVVGGLTLVTVLLTAETTWVLQVGSAVLAAAAIVDRRLLRSAAFWFALLAVYVVGVVNLYDVIDNHEYLLGYWLLALGVSQAVAARGGAAPPPADEDGATAPATLAESARLLIGLAFLFATVWKAATPDYVSGNAFHTFLLFDPRFAGLGAAASDLTLLEGGSNLKVFQSLLDIGDRDVAVPVADAGGVARLAGLMTWWTLTIEGAVAVGFLAPPRSVVGRARHGLLLAFLFTTYVLAPVMGFGWTLVAMGLAQAPLDRHRLLLPAFAAAFVLVSVRSTAPVDRLFALVFD